tara:strand:- start:1074 stop:2240 length:1167 start_codon:yes stop_codon:yes gene_type:complete
MSEQRVFYSPPIGGEFIFLCYNTQKVMDTVELEGVRYVKASVAAKKFRYTQDYIGQLCRGKKIDARLVGRTWFVNTDSIVEHRSNKYKTRKTVEPVEVTKIRVEETAGERAQSVSVEPVITNKAVKSLKVKPTIHKTKEGQRRLTIEYSVDEEALLPTLRKRVEKAPKRVPVVVANAKTVRVRSKRSQVSFRAGKLPEVALSGKLKIEDYPEAPKPVDGSDDVTALTPSAADDSENTFKNKDISDKRENKTVKVKETAGSRSKKVVLKKLDVAMQAEVPEPDKPGVVPPVAKITPELVPSRPKADNPTGISSPEGVGTPYFHPRSVRTPENTVKVSLLVSISPLVATIFALGCVVLIFSASALVVVNDLSLSSTVVFQKANLLDVLSP